MPTTNTINNRSDEFAGKVAFITGAGSGIGRATALAFADRGAAVSIADVSAEASRAVADEIVHAGGQALGLSCDVTSSTDVQTALQQTVEAFGRLDFAFNNAGIEQPPTPLADITEDQWQRVLDIRISILKVAVVVPPLEPRLQQIYSDSSHQTVQHQRQQAKHRLRPLSVHYRRRVAAPVTSRRIGRPQVRARRALHSHARAVIPKEVLPVN